MDDDIIYTMKQLEEILQRNLRLLDKIQAELAAVFGKDGYGEL